MQEFFNYSGTVNITLAKQRYKFKNNGYPALFRLFAMCLADPKSISEINTPYQLDLQALDDSGRYDSILYYSIRNLYKDVITTDNGYGVRVTGTILPTNINEEGFSSKYRLILRDGESEPHDLAYIEVNSDLIKQISAGRQALIEWILEIRNPTTKEAI